MEEKKIIQAAVVETLTELSERIRYLTLVKNTMANNLTDILTKIAKYKYYDRISISNTGSVYIYLEDQKVIRISDHKTGKAAKKKKPNLVENLVY